MADVKARLSAYLDECGAEGPVVITRNGKAAGVKAGHDADLTTWGAEAIRLARIIRVLMAPYPPEEATGLLALMLLHDSRRDARVDEAGDLVVLEEQDRSRWNHAQIAEALPLVEESLRLEPGPYGLQAAIAAEHCKAARAEDTNWARIVLLYGLLARLQPSPIVILNRAVAVAMAEGPAAALPLIDAVAREGSLDRYPFLPSARGDILFKLGRFAEARADFERAASLTRNAREQRLLLERAAACVDQKV